MASPRWIRTWHWRKGKGAKKKEEPEERKLPEAVCLKKKQISFLRLVLMVRFKASWDTPGQSLESNMHVTNRHIYFTNASFPWDLIHKRTLTSIWKALFPSLFWSQKKIERLIRSSSLRTDYQKWLLHARGRKTTRTNFQASSRALWRHQGYTVAYKPSKPSTRPKDKAPKRPETPTSLDEANQLAWR